MRCSKPWRKTSRLIVSCSFAVLLLGTACSSSAPEPPKIESKPYIQHSEPAQVQQEPAKVEEEEAQPLPPYQDMISAIDGSIGTEYTIAGRVTDVSGGFRGDDYMVYVYWDESETYGEIAAVRIPYKRYTESVNRYFEGNCTLEGTDDNGHPQFVCYYYKAEHP